MEKLGDVVSAESGKHRGGERVFDGVQINDLRGDTLARSDDVVTSLADGIKVRAVAAVQEIAVADRPKGNTDE